MHKVIGFFTPLLISFATVSQAPIKPADEMLTFEVASVKLSDPSAQLHTIGCYDPTASNNSVGVGRCSIQGAPLNPIILYAYGLTGQGNYIRGGPAWMGTEQYSIEAKAENPTTTTADLKRMLQTLLADRFKLRVHFVTQDVTGYSIIVGKNGSKLKPGDPSASRGDNNLEHLGCSSGGNHHRQQHYSRQFSACIKPTVIRSSGEQNKSRRNLCD